jgi:hypothetical protein
MNHLLPRMELFFPAALVALLALSSARSAETCDYWAMINKDGSARNASAKTIQGTLQVRWARHLNGLTEANWGGTPLSAIRSSSVSVRNGRILCIVPDSNPDALKTSRRYASFGTFLLKDGTQVTKLLTRHIGAGALANSSGIQGDDLGPGLVNQYWKSNGPLYTAYGGDQCANFVLDPYTGGVPPNAPMSQLSIDPNSSGCFSMTESDPLMFARGGNGHSAFTSASNAGFLGLNASQLASIANYGSYLLEGTQVYAFNITNRITDSTWVADGNGVVVTAYQFTQSPYSVATRWTYSDAAFSVLSFGHHHCRGALRAYCLSDDSQHLFMFGYQNTAYAPNWTATGGLQLRQLSTTNGALERAFNTGYNPNGDGNSALDYRHLAPQIATYSNYVVVLSPETRPYAGSSTYYNKTRLFCFDTTSGTLAWQTNFAAGYFTTPVSAYGTYTYYGAYNNEMGIQTVIAGSNVYVAGIVANAGKLRLKVEQFNLNGGARTTYTFDPQDSGASIPTEDTWNIGGWSTVMTPCAPAIRDIAAVDRTLVLLLDTGRTNQALVVLDGASNPAVDFPPKAVISKPDIGSPFLLTSSGYGTPTPNLFPSGAAIQFSSLGSLDPDGGALTFDWDFGDGSAHGSASNPAHAFAAWGSPSALTNRTVKLVVTDNEGNSDTNSILLCIRDAGSLVTTALTAVADSYVYCSGSGASANLGTSATLSLWKYPGDASQRTYLKFDLGAIDPATIDNAVIRLYLLHTATYGNIRAYGCDSSWSESTITGLNAPPPGAIAGQMKNTPTAYYSCWEIPVTDFVKQNPGNSLRSFVLETGAAGNNWDGDVIASKENTGGYPPPQLLVSTNSGSSVSIASQSAPATINLTETFTTPAIALLGSSSQGEGVLTYNWYQESGPSTVSFATNNCNAAKTNTVTITGGKVQGAYVVRCNVFDGLRSILSDPVTINLTRTTPLTVTVNQAAGQADPTNGAPLNFTAVFSASVTGFSQEDVVVDGSETSAKTVALTGSGSTYNIAVSGMSVFGTVTVSIPADVVADGSGNGNQPSTSTDNSILYLSGSGPYLLYSGSAFLESAANNGTIGNTLALTLGGDTFNGTNGENFVASGRATVQNVPAGLTAILTRSSTTQAVFSLSGAAGSHANSNDVANLTLAFQNSAFAGGSAAAVTYSARADLGVDFLDPYPVTVTINQAAGQLDPTNTSPVNFTVVFSEAVADFTGSDVTLGGTAGATTAVVTGSGTSYNVAVSGMSAPGTVTAALAAGVAHSAATGGTNLASTSTDNSVSYDAVAPSVTINKAAAQADPCDTTPVHFTVLFGEPVTDFTTGDVTLGGTAGAATAVVTGSGTNYDVAVSGMTQAGTVTAALNAGVAHDAAGNASLASTSTDNVVDYTPRQPPPALQADTTANDVDHALAITFTDSTSWRAAVTNVRWGATSLAAGQYSLAPGTLTISQGVVRVVATQTVAVLATGYDDASVSQPVLCGAPARLLVLTQPGAPATNGGALSPQPAVRVADQYSNTVSTSTLAVSAARADAGAWALGGATSATAAGGIATFAGLTATSVSTVSGAQLQFTASGCASALSATFTLSASSLYAYISAAGSDATGDGTLGNPWRTITNAAAHALAGATNVINLLPGTFTESNITLPADKALVLQGGTRDDTIVQAHVQPFAAAYGILTVQTNLTLRNLTLRNGCRNGNGGAVLVGSSTMTLQIEGCRLASNFATNGNGGAVYCGSATQVNILGTEIVSNRCLTPTGGDQGGGGICCLVSSLTISNCSASANRALGDGNGGSGGFVYNKNTTVSGCTLTLVDVSIVSNYATNTAGAVYGRQDNGSMIFERCSFIANSTTVGGGGAMRTLYAPVTLKNCTFYSNSVPFGGNVGGAWKHGWNATASAYNCTFCNNSAPNGGAIETDNNASIALYSCIVASNTLTGAGSGPDIYHLGTSFTATNSLIGDNANSGLAAALPDARGNYIGSSATGRIDPLLRPLAGNGGLTPTCRLRTGSLAIDHGCNPLGLATDQTGFRRTNNTATDIGAYEWRASGACIALY